MELLQVVAGAWRFAGLVPHSIIQVNAFGNVLVDDIDGRIWRICPEELSCRVVAASRVDLLSLQKSEDFRVDWEMERLVGTATSLFGSPSAGRCFCLKIPAVLGGQYGRDNLGTISIAELIAASGDMAHQIRDLPDGAKVKLKVVE
jgi:hypothetical protein